MAKKSFDSLGKLEKEIVRRANKALNNEVKDYVVDELKSRIKKDVYSSYSPVMYDRREGDGGLLDDTSVGDENTGSIQAHVYRRTLRVYERAEVDPPKLKHKEYNAQDGLTQLIETGAKNPWNNRHYKWQNERPFMSNTQDYINNHPKQIVDMLKARIEHDNDEK